MPVRATRWVSSVPYILDIEASAFGTMPWLCIHATLYDIPRDTSASTNRRASLRRTCGSSLSGLPSRSVCFA